jgi:hypothetical protein
LCYSGRRIEEFISTEETDVLDITKNYKTKDGREIRIYSMEAGGNYPIHGAILLSPGNSWSPQSWTSEGNSLAGDRGMGGSTDLVEVKTYIRYSIWVNIYESTIHPDDCPISPHNSKSLADYCAREGRVACVEVIIDCEEGDGL